MAERTAGGSTLARVARLDPRVNGVAVDRDRRMVVAWNWRGDVTCLAARDGGGWRVEARATAFYRSALRRFVGDNEPITAGAVFADGTLYMTVAVEGGLKGDPDRWSVFFAADPTRRVVRPLAWGRESNQDPPAPVLVGRRFALVGFCNGVAAVALSTGRTHWVGDPERDEETFFAPDGVMYAPKDHTLVVHSVEREGPGRIDVLHLTRNGRVKGRTRRVIGRRAKSSRAYEGPVHGGDCLNPYTGELAYVIVEEGWPLDGSPKDGPTARFADLYVGPPAGPARRYGVTGEVGVNVGPLDDERYRRYFRDVCFAAPQVERVFLRPLGPDRYLLGLFGGTLCLREPRAGRQTVLHQLPSRITALQAGFDPGSYVVGLADGELLLVRVPDGEVPGRAAAAPRPAGRGRLPAR